MKQFVGLLGVLLVAVACSTGAHSKTTIKGCTEYTGAEAPVVCVDDTVSPPTLSSKEVHVQKAAANGGPTYVTWKSINGSTIDIQVRPDPSTNTKCHAFQFKKTCSGDTCKIKVNPKVVKNGKPGRCEYDLTVNGVTADPVIIVEEYPLIPPR